MSSRISLIVATVGRYDEIRSLLGSLASQTLPAKAFEIIIVDQNDTIDLQPILATFEDKLTIHHLKSTTRGLSANRNIGLELAEGDIVAFPDDDCAYYPDTLEAVYASFDRYPDAALLLGAIYDRSKGVPLIRRWPRESRRVSKWNFYLLLSSITIFSKAKNIRFDERLGLGTKFGSNEDADYVYQILRRGSRVRYEPSVQVYHPVLPAWQSSVTRVSGYGLGFGAFVAKNASLSCVALFLQAVLYHLVIAARAACTMDFEAGRAHLVAAYSRLLGVFQFAFRSEVRRVPTAVAGRLARPL